ncbi:uncharacterized protein LOC129944763 [Eupeodes corollae]|nr:uncharacterized protein LOC129944763 [Eupeodes corollae]
MLSAGYADSDTTSTHLEVKIQTLVRAYKYAIDNNNRTGAAPCVAPFMEKMDELFGSKPIVTNVHNVTYGAAAIGNSSETSEDNTTQPSDENSDDMQLHTTQPSDANYDDMLETTATDDVPSTSTAAASKRRKISRSLYFKMKIEEKQKDREDKNRKNFE